MVQTRRSDYAPKVQPRCPVEAASPGTASEVDQKKELNHDPKTSGATKEAAASKIMEHGLEGRANEARLRAMQNPTVMVNGQPVASPAKEEHQHPNITSKQSGTVQINGKSALRKAVCEDPKDTNK